MMILKPLNYQLLMDIVYFLLICLSVCLSVQESCPDPKVSITLTNKSSSPRLLFLNIDVFGGIYLFSHFKGIFTFDFAC